ncbi:hypothetical protein BD289DRAFT_486369 [Coniella lustricola]|uniref:Protein kinase domain-containing protein n=1 Tax=Coniella lustricola TaxID=2025994 RepID=A0A2T2ZVB5_9PEZI|nr:hypothetical protein BD289DRAFT_486369 [Coniella lustricola]
MASTTANPPSQPAYDILHEVAPRGVRLVRRRADGATFLGTHADYEQTAPQLHSLLARGAGNAVAALLCHPNLVSCGEVIPLDAFYGGGWARRANASKDALPIQTWDYCAAGSLETLLQQSMRPVKKDPTTGKVLGWMPESLCWHVAISLLSALSWLHEGYVEYDMAVYDTDDNDNAGDPTKGQDKDKAGSEKPPRRVPTCHTAMTGRGNEDWMPVLHRAVVPGNVFFQQPKGSETYGLCKLGNYSKVVVVGHVAGHAKGSPVACSDDGLSSLAQLKMDMAVENIYKLPKAKRPYLRGTEIHQVGAILYRLMTRDVLPDKEECPVQGCNARHWIDETEHTCNFATRSKDLDGTTQFILRNRTEPLKGCYTDQLIQCLERLLSYHRSEAHAPTLLREAQDWYLLWKRTTDAGKEHRDVWDDWVLRQENKMREVAKAREAARKQSGEGAVDYVELALEVQAEAQEKVDHVRREADWTRQVAVLEELGRS